MTGTRLLKNPISSRTSPNARARNIFENLTKLVDKDTSCEFPGKHTCINAPSSRASATCGMDLSLSVGINDGSGRGNVDLATVCKSPPTARRLSRSESRSR